MVLIVVYFSRITFFLFYTQLQGLTNYENMKTLDKPKSAKCVITIRQYKGVWVILHVYVVVFIGSIKSKFCLKGVFKAIKIL